MAACVGERGTAEIVVQMDVLRTGDVRPQVSLATLFHVHQIETRVDDDKPGIVEKRTQSGRIDDGFEHGGHTRTSLPLECNADDHHPLSACVE